MDAKQPAHRKLQGPRPTPLRIRKDSHKIKKPPVAPAQPQPAPAPPVQYRPPVIIYAISPKVIHTNPSEFMSLVQRLTGSSSSSSSAASAAGADASTSAPSLPAYNPFLPVAAASPLPYTSYLPPGFLSGPSGIGGLSPAARLATIEQGRKEPRNNIGAVAQSTEDDLLMLSQFGIDSALRLNPFGQSPAGILSPLPSSLPVISPNLFSPLNNTDNPAGTGLGFLHDLMISPLSANRSSFTGNNLFATTPGSFFMNTPTSANFFSSIAASTPPAVTASPGAYWDIFHHQYQDL